MQGPECGQLGVGRVLGSGGCERGCRSSEWGRLVRGLGCQQWSAPAGMSMGLGSALLALAEGGVSWRRGSQCLRGSWLGNKPSGASDGAGFQSTQRSGKEGRGWGPRSCWQGLFSKPWGGPSCPGAHTLHGSAGQGGRVMAALEPRASQAVQAAGWRGEQSRSQGTARKPPLCSGQAEPADAKSKARLWAAPRSCRRSPDATAQGAAYPAPQTSL